MTREEWLQAAVSSFRPDIKAAGLKLPRIVHVSMGLPSVRALAAKNRSIGQCWNGSTSADGNPHIFVSPVIDDGARALDVLVHELIHACGVMGHKKDFKKAALALGLTGKMTQTVASPELTKRLNALIKEIGRYPHSPITGDDQRKKQGTRMLKAECEDCGAIVRLTRKVVEDPGLPTCACGGAFELA